MSIRRLILIASVLAVALFVGLFVRTYGTPGQTQNGGLVVQIGQGFGLEVWGQPGFFDCGEGC